MFNLKDKLLAKGLISKEQISKLEQKAQPKPSQDEKKFVNELKNQDKVQQYITIRKWVDKNRLDKEFISALDTQKFFINSKDAQVSWLNLTPEVIKKIEEGHAGVIAYMSNNGLAHAVVPKDIALDVGEVFPLWLKVLNIT